MAVVAHDEKCRLLSRHALFGELRPDELDGLLKLSRERRYADGQIIFQKGDQGPSLMAVLQGRVRISTCSEEGREITLSIVEPGQIFGEIALLDGRERSADATALGPCTVLVIDRRDFACFLERSPQVAARLLAFLCRRLRDADEMIEDMAFLPLPKRLARTLLKLAHSYGQRTGKGLRIGLRLTQRDLGNLLAISRETVNRQLRAWEDEGLIANEDGYITLRRPEELEDRLES